MVQYTQNIPEDYLDEVLYIVYMDITVKTVVNMCIRFEIFFIHTGRHKDFGTYYKMGSHHLNKCVLLHGGTTQNFS